MYAADHNLIARVRLLLTHGADQDGSSFWFTGAERRTAYQRAALAGNTEIAGLLPVTGAARATFDPAQETRLGRPPRSCGPPSCTAGTGSRR